MGKGQVSEVFGGFQIVGLHLSISDEGYPDCKQVLIRGRARHGRIKLDQGDIFVFNTANLKRYILSFTRSQRDQDT